MVVQESQAWTRNTRNKLEGTEQDYDHFVALLSSRLESVGIAFKFAYFGTRMRADLKKMPNDGTHRNLSRTDYALLCAAVSRPGMDVMTDDKELACSINNERGAGAKGKIHSVMSNYSKRRGDKRPEPGTPGDGAVPGGLEDRREAEGRHGGFH